MSANVTLQQYLMRWVGLMGAYLAEDPTTHLLTPPSYYINSQKG
jgi:hypothetical protein